MVLRHHIVITARFVILDTKRFMILQIEMFFIKLIKITLKIYLTMQWLLSEV